MGPVTEAPRAEGVPRPPADRRTIVEEVLVVLSLSVLSSVAYAILSLVEAPIAGVVVAAADQSNAFVRQVLAFAFGLAPVFLVVHLVRRSGEGLAVVGFPPPRPLQDAGRGAVLFVLVGLVGLGV
ncbi:MAG TPA: hypothetical protein VF108_09110, partial [Actinomycetota bacterium]